MSLSSPNTLGGINRVRDHLAYLVDGQTDDANLPAALLDHYEDRIENALDAIAQDTGLLYHERREHLNTKPPVTVGDADVTRDSTAVTSDHASTVWQTGTPVNAGLAQIRTSQDAGGYLISAVAGEKSLTLAHAYIGATGANLTYEIANSDYNLAAGVWQLLGMRELQDTEAVVRIVTYDEWIRMTAGAWQTGRPTLAVVMGRDPSATGASGTAFRLRLWPYPDQRYAYEYRYRTVPTFPGTGATLESAPGGMNLLLFRAAAYLFGDRGDHGREREYMQRYRDELPAVRRTDGTGTTAPGPMLARWWGMGEDRVLAERGRRLVGE